jgi:hypothetical protein
MLPVVAGFLDVAAPSAYLGSALTLDWFALADGARLGWDTWHNLEKTEWHLRQQRG